MMLNEFTILILFSVFLFLINFLQKKYNLCLDRPSGKESHKFLLKLNEKVPLSGSFYFFPILFLLTYEINFIFAIVCFLFFLIGFLSDTKITNSPKIRLLFQFLLIIIFIFFNNHIKIDTRILFLNNLIENEFFRILIVSFFFLVLINGYNFIDGVNNLSLLNILIILIFIKFLSKDIGNYYYIDLINILILASFVFVVFNFFGKNFLGDGGIYGLSFLIGFILIEYSLFSATISPFFIANLLWYPAFEILFCITRRSVFKKKNYLPDNQHLHHLIFKFIKKKKLFNKKYLLSSFVGVIINIYLVLFYILGFHDYSDTKLQISLIFINTSIYLFIYYKLKNIVDD